MLGARAFVIYMRETQDLPFTLISSIDVSVVDMKEGHFPVARAIWGNGQKPFSDPRLGQFPAKAQSLSSNVLGWQPQRSLCFSASACFREVYRVFWQE